MMYDVGGHFSLLGLYLEESDELVIADTNPMKYLKYWRSKLTNMFAAMIDKDTCTSRARGVIRLSKDVKPNRRMKLGRQESALFV